MQVKLQAFKAHFPRLNIAIILAMLSGATLFIFIVQGINRDYSGYAGFERGTTAIDVLKDGYEIQSNLNDLNSLLENVELPKLTDAQSESVLELNAAVRLHAEVIFHRYPKKGSGENLFIDLSKLSEGIDNLLENNGEIQQQEINQIIQYISGVQFEVEQISNDSIVSLNGYIRGQDILLDRHNSILLSVILLLIIGVAILLLVLIREVGIRKAQQDAEDEIKYLAFHDHLTELPNRTKFCSLVSQKVRTESLGSVWVMDLDFFKRVNDTFGHDAGDHVLKCTAIRLFKEFQNYGGEVSRVSGDEFIGWLPYGPLEDIHKFAEKMLTRISRPIEYNSNIISCRMSIGIVPVYSVTEDELSIEYLSQLGDFTLYLAKRSGRSRYKVFNRQMRQEFNERNIVASQLNHDIENGRCDVFLQPKFDIQSGMVYGFEALARWKFQDEYFPPDKFIKFAEETGLILKLDEFVMREAINCVTDWNNRHNSKFSLSANISSLHFNDEESLGFIFEILQGFADDSVELTLEITESLEVASSESIIKVLANLKDIGCRISIDDFGTGYSSLAQIEKLCADELKIDKSLIKDINLSPKAKFLLKSITDYAQGYLEMDIVCEGVENIEQIRVLKDLGCRSGQGFYFSEALPMRDALQLACDSNKYSVSIEP